MTALPLSSIRIKHFKSIRDTGDLPLNALNVLIGSNGAGKSSLVQGLQFVRDCCIEGIEEATYKWKSFENIRNRATQRSNKRFTDNRRRFQSPSTVVDLSGSYDRRRFHFRQEISLSPNGDELFLTKESFREEKRFEILRNAIGTLRIRDMKKTVKEPALAPDRAYSDDESIAQTQYAFQFLAYIKQWQFLELDPFAMVTLSTHRRSQRELLLDSSGKNIASYLLALSGNANVLNGIVEAVGSILGYGTDLRAKMTSEYERAVYLQLVENDMQLPSWLLSTGTLRLVALLAVLRNPKPSPLVVIEEIENGLDPRSIHLIVDEIKEFTSSGSGQIIVTTHSPYLLDLIPIESIITCERDDGEPKFRRPADEESIREWANRFAPGKLYTMGRFFRRDRQ